MQVSEICLGLTERHYGSADDYCTCVNEKRWICLITRFDVVISLSRSIDIDPILFLHTMIQ
jgi:hypothetical protein